MKKRIEDVITDLVQPIVEKHSFELVDVEFVKEAGNWYLRVYIDKPQGITIDDCQTVSEELSDEIDKTDPIEQSYFLEVSSPGLERPLKKDKDFQRFKGEQVEIKVYEPIEGKKVFEGELLGLKDGIISIRTADGNVAEFPQDKTALVRRMIKF